MLDRIASTMIVFLLLALSATCFADGDYSKFCNRPECDPSHEPVPNIFTAMTGYNILKGNPLPQSKNMLKDPGFDNMAYIFLPTVKNGENRYALDDGLTVRTIKSFMTSPESEIIKNTKDYQKSLKTVTSQGTDLATNLEYDVSVSVPVKGAEVGVETTVPPMAAAAFGSNNAFRKNERFFSEKTGILVNARAHGIIYTVKVSQTRPPKFHPGFIAMLKELQAANQGDDREKNEKVEKLIENFGTHYLRNADMGARIAITKRYDRNEAMKTTEEEMQECTKSSLNLFFGLVNTASSKCTKEIESKNTRWTREYSRQYITSFGSAPQKDLISWANQDFDAPIPIRMTLDPIVNLFRGVFMDNLKDGKQSLKIEYKKILAWLLPKYLKYCEDHKSELNIATCDVANLKKNGCGWNDDCEFDQECKNDESKKEGYVCTNKERTYQILLKTSDIGYGGTDSNVKIELIDDQRHTTREIVLDDEKNNFEAGSTDKFQFTTNKRMGELEKVRIKKDSAGTAPGWHLKLVRIKDVLRDRVYEFPCEKWLYSGSYECYETSKRDEFNSKKKKKTEKNVFRKNEEDTE